MSIAVILKGYPRLSETFIAQEIHALESRGLDLRLISLRHPTDRAVHPIHQAIRAPVDYLPEYLHWEPFRVLRAWLLVSRHPGYKRARATWLADLRRDPTRNRIRRFGQALVLAAELPDDVEHLYAHFLHTPASVARYASIITGLPWSCSAHAKDIWTSPDWEKREKLADCRWLVTCTAANRRHLARLAREPSAVELVYHGLDFSRFPAPESRAPGANGRDAAHPVIILSVGRAVSKKGYDDLLRALARVPDSLLWRFVHVGGGELLHQHGELAKRLRIAGRIDWLGPLPQDSVLEQYRKADLFVLASRVAESGDRDGLPNVLMEAQSQRLACLSTNISGIPELIESGVTGVLVPERDVEALTEALVDLIVSPERRVALAEAGFRCVRARFSFEDGIERLVQRFRLACTHSRTATRGDPQVVASSE